MTAVHSAELTHPTRREKSNSVGRTSAIRRTADRGPLLLWGRTRPRDQAALAATLRRCIEWLGTRDSRSADVVDRGNPPRSSTGAEPWNSGLRLAPPLRHRMLRGIRTHKLEVGAQAGHIRAVRLFAKTLGRAPDSAIADALRRFLHTLRGSGIPSAPAAMRSEVGSGSFSGLPVAVAAFPPSAAARGRLWEDSIPAVATHWSRRRANSGSSPAQQSSATAASR